MSPLTTVYWIRDVASSGLALSSSDCSTITIEFTSIAFVSSSEVTVRKDSWIGVNAKRSCHEDASAVTSERIEKRIQIDTSKREKTVRNDNERKAII